MKGSRKETGNEVKASQENSNLDEKNLKRNTAAGSQDSSKDIRDDKFTSVEEFLKHLNSARCDLDKTFADNSLDHLLLMLGNTGDGKSTVRKLLSGNVEDLTVVGTNPYIKDSNKEIGDGTGVSCTISPNVFPIPNSDMTGVDNPGWNDNRGPLNELLNMQLLSHVANKSRQLKFLIVVQFASLQRATNHEPRLKSFGNAMQIIRHVPESLTSVGLVVTKVENNETWENDAKVLEEVIGVLEAMKEEKNIKKDNAQLDLIEQLIKTENIFLLRRPTKRVNIETVALKEILVDPSNPESTPYYQAVCSDLLEFCNRLEYVKKSANTNFVVSPSDAAKFRLTDGVFPILLDRIQSSFEPLLKEVLERIETKIKSNNEDSNTYLKLVEAENILEKCQSPTQERSASQIFTHLGYLFDVTFDSDTLNDLANAENHFRELQQMTQIPNAISGRYCTTADGMRSLANKIIEMQTKFDGGKQHNIRNYLKNLICTEINSQISSLESAYLIRHKSLTDSKALRGLAFKKLEDHLQAVLSLSPSEISNPETGFQLLYRQLGLPLATKVGKEGLHRLSLAHHNIAKLDKSDYEPQKLLDRIQMFFSSLLDDYSREQWMADIEKQLKFDITLILTQFQKRCLSFDEPENYRSVEARISLLTSLNLRLEGYLAELEEKLKTPGRFVMSQEVKQFCGVLEIEHSIKQITSGLEGPEWQKLFTNTGISLRDGVSKLITISDNLLARYQYMNEIRRFCSESYEVYAQSRRKRTGEIDENKLLASVMSLSDFPTRPPGIESCRDEKIVLQEFFDKALDCYPLDNGNTLVMFGTVNISFKNWKMDYGYKLHDRAKLNLYLVAGDTVFVDHGLTSQGSVNILFVGAKSIQCVDSQEIVLRGRTGTEIPRATNGKIWGEDGDNGNQGSPGGPGGDIYLVTENALVCPQLLVCSVGGRGGPGQNGGDGYDGRPESRGVTFLFEKLNSNFAMFDDDFESICDHFKFTPPNLGDLRVSKENDLPPSATSYESIVEKVQRRFHLVAVLETILNFLVQNLHDDGIISKHCFCQTFEEITSIFEVTEGKVEHLLRDVLEDKSCRSTLGVCEVVSRFRKKNEGWRQVVLQKTVSPSSMTDGFTTQRYWDIVDRSSEASLTISKIHEYLITDSRPPSESNPSNSADSGTTYVPKNVSRGRGGTGGDGGVGGCPGKLSVYPERGIGYGLQHKIVRVHGAPGKKGLDGNQKHSQRRVQKGEEAFAAGSDTECPHCPQNSEHWGDDVVEPLLECLNSSGDPNKMYRLFSSLVTHDWAVERVLTTETFVTAYLNLLIDTCSKGAFTQDRVQVEQDFQKHLRTFQNVRKLEPKDHQVVTSLLASSQMVTDNVRRFLNVPKLIFNLEKHLQISLKKLDALHTSRKIVQWTDNHLTFQQLLEEKIRQTKATLGKDISDAIEDIRRGFQKHQDKLQSELETCTKLLESRAKYERAEKIVRLLGYVLTLPVAIYMGPTVPSTMNLIKDYMAPVLKVSSAIAALIKELKPDFKAPKAVVVNPLNDREALWREVGSSVEKQRRLLEKAIQIQSELKPSFVKFVEKFENRQKELDACTVIIDEAIGSGKIHRKRLLKCLDKIDETRGALFKVLEAKRASCPTTDEEKRSLLDNLKLDLTLADWKDSLFDTTKGGQMTAAIEYFIRRKAVNEAKKRVATVKNSFEPAIENLVDVVQDHLQTEGSFGGAQASRWKFKDILLNVKDFLGGFVKDLPSEQGFQQGFKKIDRALEMHIAAWDSIREYEERQETATFIAKACSSDVDYSSLEIGDALKSKLSKIQFLVYAHLLLMEFRTTKNAFEQWCFPYAHRYLGRPDVVEAVRDVEGLCSGNLKTVRHDDILNMVVETAGKAANIVKQFHAEFEYSQCVWQKKDDVSGVATFSEGNKTKPFYTWKSAKCRDLIWQLFSGYPTKFVADPRESPENKAAIKVNGDVDLRFIYNNGEATQTDYQEALDTLLQKFRLEMTFHGDSLYRVEENIYVIQGDQIRLTGNVETGEVVGRAKSVENNDSREKMKDFVMSPYGTWTFRLKLAYPKDHPSPENVFAELADMFGYCVDIQLVGFKGRFLNEDAPVWEENKPQLVGNYYSLYLKDGNREPLGCGMGNGEE